MSQPLARGSARAYRGLYLLFSSAQTDACAKEFGIIEGRIESLILHHLNAPIIFLKHKPNGFV